MSILKKIGAGVLGILVILIILVGTAIYSTARSPSRAIGVQSAAAIDADGRKIPVMIFYPTNATPKWTWLGAAAVKIAPNGPTSGKNLPLVVISHGTGATSLSHIDTALALAEAGYVVAAPMHPGDNYQDQSKVGTAGWIEDRARQLKLVTDFMLGNWTGRADLDPTRVGIFGYSAGGAAALMDIGGRLDLTQVREQCALHPEFVCQLMKPAPASSSGSSAPDTRVKAAVLVAPGLGFGFTTNSLSKITVPVQLWAGTADTNVPPATNAEFIARSLSTKPDLELVQGAGHFSFLASCGVLKPLLPPMLCNDPAPFDRNAFQKRFNRQIVKFFDVRLARKIGPEKSV
jgi:predicted dienelactone hydrolase